MFLIIELITTLGDIKSLAIFDPGFLLQLKIIALRFLEVLLHMGLTDYLLVIGRVRVPFGLTREGLSRLLQRRRVRKIITRLNSDLRRKFYCGELAFALPAVTQKTFTFPYY